MGYFFLTIAIGAELPLKSLPLNTGPNQGKY